MSRKRSAVHNLSHSFKYSDYLGYITPIACFDVVPGDKINHKIHALIRTQPLMAPIMHAVDIDVHAFFSPDRLVWDDSADFHSGGNDGQFEATAPYMKAPADVGYPVGSLADYLGLPTGVPDYEHSALPFRHMANIYNFYYRDSQLIPEVDFLKTSGYDDETPFTMYRPAWKRDYFTKARPAPQLGPDVVIPIDFDDSPISGLGVIPGGTNVWSSSTRNVVGGDTEEASWSTFGSDQQSRKLTVRQDPENPDFPDIYADNSGLAAGIDVLDLREASALQRVLEHNNIFGGRYMEQLMSRFGVMPEDYRLQWPQFLGAGHTKIQFSEVLNTADDTGEMKGHGISVVASNRYKYKVKEHGYIMVFMVVRPKTQYMQGIDRMWSRETRYDYLMPEFVHIGDQAILNKEIYAASADPDAAFGYTPIYEEYRTVPSRVAGEFRTTLKYWHMAREFDTEPALNADFITANPTSRIFADAQSAQLYVDVSHTCFARRLLPKNPGYRLM